MHRVTAHRVVQWATGNIGTRSLRAIIEHPDLELVGVHVHSPDKVGRDAGELCGLAPTGVTATDDVDEIAALAADCVLYMPQQPDVDVLARLLGSGTNVVTTVGLGAVRNETIERACAEGGTSIHATGSSPGFISEAVPIVLTSIQRRLDHLVIDEFADLSKRNSPELLFDLMGFGRDPSTFADSRRWSHGATSFGPSLEVTAEALGLPLDSVEGTGDVAVAARTTTIAAGTIEAGTVAAQRMIVHGLRDGTPLLTFRANWYCTTDLDPAWELGETGWRVKVEGDAPLDVHLRFDIPMERMGETTPGYTAHRAVNAVPLVCAAEPGIRTTADLPQVIARLGRR